MCYVCVMFILVACEVCNHFFWSLIFDDRQNCRI